MVYGGRVLLALSATERRVAVCCPGRLQEANVFIIHLQSQFIRFWMASLVDLIRTYGKIRTEQVCLSLYIWPGLVTIRTLLWSVIFLFSYLSRAQEYILES